MDVVYILGNGSLWNDNELKFSLRSVDKFLKNIDNVYVIGSKPSFLRNIIHIPVDDIYNGKESNIAHKVRIACETKDISNDFFFINDDHFLTKEIEVNKYPYYFKNGLHESVGNATDPNYKVALINTIEYLESRQLGLNNFDGHCPIIYNKNKFIEVTNKVEWENKEFVLKSLYCNSLKISGVMSTDCKITNKNISFLDINYLIKGKDVFSIGDGALINNVAIGAESTIKLYLKKMFKEQSKYECS